ncbi:RNA-binding protein [Burkholderia sp. IT-111MI5]
MEDDRDEGRLIGGVGGRRRKCRPAAQIDEVTPISYDD